MFGLLRRRNLRETAGLPVEDEYSHNLRAKAIVTYNIAPMPKQTEQLARGVNAVRCALADWAAQTLLSKPCPWPKEAETAGLQAVSVFFSNEGIGPLCHYALQTAGAQDAVPKDVWDLLRQASHAAAALELIRSHQDAQVLQCLGEIGLRPLVLKGAAYARTVYPQAYLRPRFDTDLLFADKASAEKAWRRLEQEGYTLIPNVVEGRFVSRQRTCVKPTYGGHALDIHWAISNTHTFVRALPYEELIQDAVPLPTVHEQARTLGAVHSLLFACFHLFGHVQIERKSQLLWLYDIRLLTEQLSDSDWRAFSQKAITKGIAGICRNALDLVNEQFPTPMPASTRSDLRQAESQEAFRPDRLKTAFLYHLHDLKALDHWRDRLQCIGETLFPSPAYMRSKYERTSSAWLPLLYLHRAATGVADRLGWNARPNRHR